MNIALITISSLSLVVSVATLTVVLVGGKKAKDEVDKTKKNVNKSFQHLVDSMQNFEI